MKKILLYKMSLEYGILGIRGKGGGINAGNICT